MPTHNGPGDPYTISPPPAPPPVRDSPGEAFEPQDADAAKANIVKEYPNADA